MIKRLKCLIGQHVTLIDQDQETNEVTFRQTGTITGFNEPSCLVYLQTDANETIQIHLDFFTYIVMEGWIRCRVDGYLNFLEKQRQTARDDQISHSIYALIDPRDTSICYIGMTRNAELRYKQHLHLSGTNERKNAWIRDLQALHLQPQFTTIEKITGKRATLERERYWIAYYRYQGASLTN